MWKRYFLKSGFFLLCALPLLGLHPASPDAPGDWSAPVTLDTNREYHDSFTGPDGTLHVLLEVVSSAVGGPWYMARDPEGGWSAPERIYESNLTSYLGFLRLDGNGALRVFRPYLVPAPTTGMRVYTSWRNAAGNWTAWEMISALADEIRAGPAVTVMADGTLDVMWSSETDPLGVSHRRFTTSWQPIERVDPPGTLGRLGGLAATADNRVHYFYFNNSTDLAERGLYHRIENAGSWSAPELISPPASTYDYDILLTAVALGNDVHLVWQRFDLGTEKVIHYQRYQNGAWLPVAETLTPPGEFWNPRDLEVEAGGVAISATEAVSPYRNLILWRLTGETGWQERTTDCTSELIFDAYLTLHAMCVSTTGLTHMSKTVAGGWQEQIVQAWSGNSAWPHVLVKRPHELGYIYTRNGDTFYRELDVPPVTLAHPIYLPTAGVGP